MKEKQTILKIAATYALGVLLEKASSEDLRLQISELRTKVSQEEDLDIKNIVDQVDEIKQKLKRSRKK